MKRAGEGRRVTAKTGLKAGGEIKRKRKNERKTVVVRITQLNKR
jgi:hypothetical protein